MAVVIKLKKEQTNTIDAHPLRLGIMFDLVFYLHWLQGFADSSEGHRYCYVAYFSSKGIVGSSPTSRAHYWFSQASALLGSIGITMECPLPFQFSLDAPTHLLTSWQELNKHVKTNIYKQYIITTWRNPPRGSAQG